MDIICYNALGDHYFHHKIIILLWNITVLLNYEAACHYCQQVKLSVISFGSGGHQDAVLSALDSAVQNGHWLVLNNCHLLDCWDVRVVNKLTQVVYSTTKGDSNNHASYTYKTLLTRSKPPGCLTDLETDGPLLNAGSTGRFVHPQFRLWLITKSDRLHSIPGSQSSAHYTSWCVKRLDYGIMNTVNVNHIYFLNACFVHLDLLWMIHEWKLFKNIYTNNIICFRNISHITKYLFKHYLGCCCM